MSAATVAFDHSPTSPPIQPAAEPPNDRRERARQLFGALAALPAGCPEHHRTREHLVEMHLPLVRFFARRYAGRGEPFDDLLQAGAVGLVKAVHRTAASNSAPTPPPPSSARSAATSATAPGPSTSTAACRN